MKGIVAILGVFVFCVGCGYAPYKGVGLSSVDEFVMDSYKIQEGKWGILELKGEEPLLAGGDLLKERTLLLKEGQCVQFSLYHPDSTIVRSVKEGRICIEGGEISLPVIAPVHVEGLSVEEARQRLEREYQKKEKEARVFISKSPHEVELIGLVESNRIAVDGKKRLFEVLSAASISPKANLFKSYVVRNDALLPIDLYRLVKEGDMSQNIVMEGGDKIYIADSFASTVMVLGEVGKEGVLPVLNGFMGLKDALSQMGGIRYTGSKRSIQVIRGNLTSPKIYTLHWEHILRLPSDSMLLMPGDIVYVASTPITQWNRFVSQILPTLAGINFFTGNSSSGILVE